MLTRGMLRALTAAAVMATLAPVSPSASGADELAAAITGGKAGVSLRYRFEHVDQDAFEEDALASTLRGRLNFTSAAWHGFSLLGEFDYVADLVWDDYNAGAGNTPDKTEYPVVSDPTGSDLNQAWLQWQNAAGFTLRGGRQRIIYDNARFVGNVGWRQNEQTYDAAWLQQKTSGGLDVQVAWVWQVNRIFGDDVPAGKDDSQTLLANLGREFKDVGKLTGYYYDIDDEDVATFSTRTLGARFSGSFKTDSTAIGYGLEFARQEDGHDNPVSYSENYFRVDLSASWGKITPYIGYESLGGDDSRSGASFRTPLATLHAFNGWADKFLTTPDAGLADLFAGLKGSLGTWQWDLIYHDFEAESGSVDLGEEIDGSLTRQFADHYAILFKAAWYDGVRNTPYDDTTKLWLQLTADF